MPDDFLINKSFFVRWKRDYLDWECSTIVDFEYWQRIQNQ